MLLFLIPALVLGALALSQRGRNATEAAWHAQVASSPHIDPPAPALASGRAPSPISVMGALLVRGQFPPPDVIMAAIAEAETTGQLELAHDIVDTFVRPVVDAHERARVQAYVSGGAPAQHAPAPAQAHAPAPVSAPVQAHAPAPAASLGQSAPAGVTDEEMAAALEAMRTGQTIRIPAKQAQTVVRGELWRDDAPASAPASAGDASVPMPASPISGVSAHAWATFVARVSSDRDASPSYAGKRHVGQFRQRRERLVELGIDPQRLVGDLPAQYRALALEIADGYRRACSSGLTDEIGEGVFVGGELHEVSLSGLLGVMQTAGLEGALAWVEHPGDRERFPHTTAAFLRTNGIF